MENHTVGWEDILFTRINNENGRFFLPYHSVCAWVALGLIGRDSFQDPVLVGFWRDQISFPDGRELELVQIPQIIAAYTEVEDCWERIQAMLKAMMPPRLRRSDLDCTLAQVRTAERQVYRIVYENLAQLVCDARKNR